MGGSVQSHDTVLQRKGKGMQVCGLSSFYFKVKINFGALVHCKLKKN